VTGAWDVDERVEIMARRLAFDATKPDGTLRKLTDVSKLHALGWHHRIEIDEGVDRIYRWYTKASAEASTGAGQ